MIRHRPFVARLGGRLWSIVVDDRLSGRPWPRHQWGECDADGRQITVNAKRTAAEQWEALVHEVWHALNPEQDEGVVDERATEMARVIQEYGYRFIREARRKD